MAIQNAREHIDEISLDKQGITFTQHETAVKNFYDAEEVKAVYYPEVVELVQKITGAEKVHVFDHNVRCAPMCERGENGAREPVKFAHNDYTIKSARSVCATCCRKKRPKSASNIASRYQRMATHPRSGARHTADRM